MNRVFILACIASAAAFFPTSALAHHPQDGSVSLLAGALHPLSGLDHLVTALTIGWICSTSIIRLSLFGVFFAAVAVGGVAGWIAEEVGSVDLAILVLLAALGSALAADSRAPPLALYAAVGAAGALHGYAHTAEFSRDGHLLAYSVGLLMTTASLVAVGAAVGHRLQQWSLCHSVRVGSGALIAIGSLAALVG